MCTYTFTLDNKLVEQVRPAFRDDYAINEWLQSQLESFVRQFAEKLAPKKNKSNPINDKISELSYLKDNWDGYGAVKIPTKVISNCKTFVNALTKYKIKTNANDFTPTPYGTIVVDVNTQKGVISFEIGTSQLGYFIEFDGGKNSYSDGIDTDFKEVLELYKLVKYAKISDIKNGVWYQKTEFDENNK